MVRNFTTKVLECSDPHLRPVESSGNDMIRPLSIGLALARDIRGCSRLPSQTPGPSASIDATNVLTKGTLVEIAIIGWKDIKADELSVYVGNTAIPDSALRTLKPGSSFAFAAPDSPNGDAGGSVPVFVKSKRSVDKKRTLLAGEIYYAPTDGSNLRVRVHNNP